jgi:hypothetical protein
VRVLAVTARAVQVVAAWAAKRDAKAILRIPSPNT